MVREVARHTHATRHDCALLTTRAYPTSKVARGACVDRHGCATQFLVAEDRQGGPCHPRAAGNKWRLAGACWWSLSFLLLCSPSTLVRRGLDLVFRDYFHAFGFDY